MTDITSSLRINPVTTEPRLARYILIGTVFILIAILLFAPLIAVFSEALREGWSAAVSSLSEPDARSRSG